MARAAHCFAAGGESSESDTDADDVWAIGHMEDLSQKEHFRNMLQRDDRCETLKTALVSGNLTAIEELLDSGVNVESTLKFGWTPLMYAASVANVELMRILLNRGANANFDKDQYTVLMAACNAHVPEEQILKSVELLLSRHANPNAACRKKMTPLMYAARDGLLQVVALLAAYGSQINVQDENGFTALTWAAHQGRKKVVLKLLELGADRSIQTKDGRTSGEIAKNKNHPELFSLLSLSKNPLQGSLKHQSREDTIHRLLKASPDSVKIHKSSSYAAFGDMEVFVHGIGLEHITEILKERGITLRELLTMTKEDFIQIGIKNTRDQQKILDVAKDMQVEDMKLGELPGVINVEFSGDEFLSFLLKLNKQCIHLRAAVQSIAHQFPRDAHKLILEWNSPQSLVKVCEDLVLSTEDLNGEANKLKVLMQKLHKGQNDDPCRIQPQVKNDRWKRILFKKAVLALIGVGCVDFIIKLIQRKN